jgi:TPR repeat protein
MSGKRAAGIAMSGHCPERISLRNLNIKKLTAAAEKCDPQAQYLLGRCYHKGILVKQSCSRAAGLFRAAADQGCIPAKTSYANCLAKGNGIGVNYGKARALYREAAEAGDPRAMLGLAVMYFRGWGTKPDFAGAMRYAVKAENAMCGVKGMENALCEAREFISEVTAKSRNLPKAKANKVWDILRGRETAPLHPHLRMVAEGKDANNVVPIRDAPQAKFG